MSDISDVLTVSFDNGLKDESVLCVTRKYGEKTIMLKMELREQADILYRLLTEQMTKAEIKVESKEEKDVTNEELLEMLVLVRDLTELNKNLKKQIAMNEIKISKLNEQLNKYQFQLKEGKIVQNEISD